jgi:hypothetical protein
VAVLDEGKLLDVIDQITRDRSLTHMLLSKVAYRAYCELIADNPTAKRRALRYATAHGVALIPQAWMPYDNLVTIAAKTHAEMQVLVRAAFKEDERFVEARVVEICKRKPKPAQLKVKKLPKK